MKILLSLSRLIWVLNSRILAEFGSLSKGVKLAAPLLKTNLCARNQKATKFVKIIVFFVLPIIIKKNKRTFFYQEVGREVGR